MAGHVEDRWYRDKIDEQTGLLVLNARGKPVQEKTELYGKGMRYRVRYYNEEGKERSKSFPDRQKDKADAFLIKMQHDVLAGVFVDPKAGEVTLRTYTEQWRKGQSQDPNTVRSVTTRLSTHVYPFLGDMPLSRVEKIDTIRNWLEWMRTEKKTKASYRAQVFDLVSAILSAAASPEEKRIHRNPCKSKSVKRPKPDDRRIVPWTQERVYSVRSGVDDRYRVVVPLGGGCGLRQMEILGFSPDDIDRATMTIGVNRQIKWVGDIPVFAPPKGGKTRSVPLSPGVLKQLDDYSGEFEPVTVTLPWVEPHGDPVTVRILVNFKEEGIMWRGRSHERIAWRGSDFTAQVWQPAFKNAGLTYRGRIDGMHALRHYYASLLLAQGVSIKELSEFLGHHDPAFTLRIYTHLMPSSYLRARMAVDQTFGADTATKEESTSDASTVDNEARDGSDTDTLDQPAA
ncbi:tyrosine-type recombinase/integrase [Actinosynnema sp. CA-248983]